VIEKVYAVVAHGVCDWPEKDFYLAIYSSKEVAEQHSRLADEMDVEGLKLYGSVEVETWQVHDQLFEAAAEKIN